jgi:2-C-methyl-D-erythritol 2,4-cyclodiphosphate synthase
VIERPKPEYRSGIGTDIHELVSGRKLMLCGVQVPYKAGLAGHSDGDVGLHALEEKGWEIANVDLIIHAEQPKLELFKGQMKRCVAELLGIDFAVVNIKAKTNEGFGDIGTGDAIAATAITLLKKKFKRTL